MPKRSAKSIREELVSDYEFTQNSVGSLEYPDLVDTLKTARAAENQFNNIEVETDVSSSEDEDGDEIEMAPYSHEWTNHVLGILRENEFINGNPTADGLRRAATVVFGDFNSYTNVIQCPDVMNSGRATVVVNIRFRNRPEMDCDGAADVFYGNTEKTYAVHPVATAETRAEGRALRKALRLTKTLAAEEVTIGDEDGNIGTDGPIPQTMLDSMLVLCDRVKVNIDATMAVMGFDVSAPQKLRQKDGIAICNKIAKWARREEDMPDAVKK